MTKQTQIVLMALQQTSENHKGDWADVELAYARPYGLSIPAFRSTLAALSRAGWYRPVRGDDADGEGLSYGRGCGWGRVRLR